MAPGMGWRTPSWRPGSKLQAARSNNRFLDKRIAGLEAQLLDAGMSGRT
jgi:hypothetical protein